MRCALRNIGIALLTLVAGVGLVLFLGSRDVPESAVAHLRRPRQPELPPDQNGYPALAAALASVCMPDSTRFPKTVVALTGEQLARARRLGSHVSTETRCVTWGDIIAERVTNDVFVSGLLASNCVAILQLRQALSAPDIQGPFEPFGDRNVSQVLALSTTLSVKTVFERQRGDLAAAADTATLSLRFGAARLRHARTVVDYLVGRAVTDNAMWQARKTAMDARLSDAGMAQLAREVVLVGDSRRHLSAALDSWATSFLLETEKYSVGIFMGYTVPQCEYPHCLRPVLGAYFLHRRRTALMIDAQCQADRRLTVETYASVSQRDKQRPADSRLRAALRWVTPNEVGSDMAREREMNFAQAFLHACRLSAARSGTQLMIALARHERREGALPATLDTLVPDLIDAVPADPFDGQPFRYSRERRIVWSISEDLKDQGGSTNEVPRRPGSSRLRAEDLVFDLAAQPVSRP
jgi:hypothetical protein